MDHRDFRPGHMGSDQRRERGCVLVRVDSAGSGVDLGNRASADPGKELGQVHVPPPRG